MLYIYIIIISDLTNSENGLPNVVLLGHCVPSSLKFIYGSVMMAQCTAHPQLKSVYGGQSLYSITAGVESKEKIKAGRTSILKIKKPKSSH